ncbi:MAG: hypothetical protein KGI51_11595 [Rhodospirillales bacterium]|nr:hypothetical protein [Rhodospirillales bacterium]
MPEPIPLDFLQAYSRGEITRREIAQRTSTEVGFGALLAALHAHDLKLPRRHGDPNSPGIRLIAQLAARAPSSIS